MADKEFNLSINVQANADEATGQLSELSATIEKFGESAEQSSQQQAELAESSSELSQTEGELAESFDELSGSSESVGEAWDELAKQNEEIWQGFDESATSIEDLSAGMDEATEIAEDQADAFEAAADAAAEAATEYESAAGATEQLGGAQEQNNQKTEESTVLSANLTDVLVNMTGSSKDAAAGFFELIQATTGLSLANMGVIGALIALIGLTKASVDAASEAEQVDARVTAQLEARGMATWYASRQIDVLATSMMYLTGMDDDNIKAAESILLRYDKIGLETFPAATRAAANLSAITGQDLTASMRTLGLALQTPGERLDRLTRLAGVEFTDAEKEMLRSMTESNQVAEAQAYILDKLNANMDGAAEAMRDTYEGQKMLLSANWGNILESAGGEVLPWLNGALESINLLISWHDQLSNTLAQHELDILQTSESYEDYSKEMDRAANSAGMWFDAAGNLWAITPQGIKMIQEHVKAVNEEDLAQRRAEASTRATTEAMIEQELTMDDLQVMMRGPVRQANEQFEMGMERIGEGVEDTAEELDHLSKQIWLTPEQRAQIEAAISGAGTAEERIEGQIGAIDLLLQQPYLSEAQRTQLEETKTKLLEQKAAIDELKAAREQAIKEFMWQLTAEKLAQAGELDLAADLAERWGMIDEATAGMMKETAAATDEYLSDHDAEKWNSKMDNIMERYTDIEVASEAAASDMIDDQQQIQEQLDSSIEKTDGLRAGLYALPDEKNIKVNVDITANGQTWDGGSIDLGGYISSGGTSSPGNPITALPQQYGGDYIVDKPTLFLAGEAGRPERVRFDPVTGEGYNPSGGDTHIHLHIESFGGNQADVDRLAKTVAREVKRNAGRR